MLSLPEAHSRATGMFADLSVAIVVSQRAASA
jgi:hypothetical protein